MLESYSSGSFSHHSFFWTAKPYLLLCRLSNVNQVMPPSKALVPVALKTSVQPVPRYLVTGVCCCHVEHQLWRVPVGCFYFFSLFFNVCFASLWYFMILFWRQSQDIRLFSFYSLGLFFKEAKMCIEVHFGHNSSISSEIGGMGACVKSALITGSPVSLQQ